MEITIKRAYEQAEESDGLRVLIDRFWPRGVKKEALKCEIWAKDIAPSNELRQFFHADIENNWEEFRKRYNAELRASESFRSLAAEIKARNPQRVTLVYALNNPVRNNAVIVREALQNI